MRRVAAIVMLGSAGLVLMILLLSDSQHTNRRYRSLLPPLVTIPQHPREPPLDEVPPLPEDDRAGDCQPRDSIFFLKTHKCASSTIQNIIMRYGERHAFNFVLPAQGNYIGSPEPFSSHWIPEWLWPRSERFHMFAHHTRLNVNETLKVMEPTAAWVTILRDPVAQFESAYDYYGFNLKVHWNMSLQQFIALPLEEKKKLPRIGHGRFGQSQMAFDLGYDPTSLTAEEQVKTMLDELEARFHLVMIAEMMDESLILLRQLMCWSTDDVTYLTKNARFDEHRATLSASDRAALEEYLALDVALYRHFKARLAERIAALPMDPFLARGEALVARRLFWKQRCVTGEAKGNELKGQQHEITGRVKGYRLSDNAGWMCSRLGMAELGYTDLIRDTQRQRLAVWHRVYALLGLGMDASVPPPPEQR